MGPDAVWLVSLWEETIKKDQRKDQGKTEGEDGPLQDKEDISQWNQPCWNLDLTLWAFTTEEIKDSLSFLACGTLWQTWQTNTAPPLGCRSHCSLAFLGLGVVDSPGFCLSWDIALLILYGFPKTHLELWKWSIY